MPARLKLGAQAVAAVGVAALATLLIWNLTHQTPPPKVGAPAPVFSLRRLTGGGRLSLSSLRGKTVVLNFFASWCGPCKREAPDLEKVWRRYRAQGVVVLGIDTNDAATDGRRFLAAHGITYPVVGGASFGLAGRYGVPDLPATFVLNSSGRIVGGLILGPVSDHPYSQTFARYLDAALTA